MLFNGIGPGLLGRLESLIGNYLGRSVKLWIAEGSPIGGETFLLEIEDPELACCVRRAMKVLKMEEGEPTQGAAIIRGCGWGSRRTC